MSLLLKAAQLFPELAGASIRSRLIIPRASLRLGWQSVLFSHCAAEECLKLQCALESVCLRQMICRRFDAQTLSDICVFQQ